MHLNIVKGDFIFYAWKDGEHKRYEETVSNLKKQGYEFKEEKHDFLNLYEYYENDKGDVKVITECCA